MSTFANEVCRFLSTFFFFCSVLQMFDALRILVIDGLDYFLTQFKPMYSQFYIFLTLHITFVLLKTYYP